MKQKHVNCATCDIACQLVAVPGADGRYTLHGDPENPLAPGAICAKGKLSEETFGHPSRLKQPLKRVGERGEGKWETISWEQALSEISIKLKRIIQEHGAEAFAVSSGPWNSSTESGMTRRFMNLLGSPNYIAPVALCMGNTAAVNRLTYGWMPFPDIENTQCIVLLGHNPHKQSWVWEYIRIRLAEKRGAKLIVVDPRKSQSADRADIFLPIKVGTDAALLMGWINVIIEEQLYDKDFVDEWTVGFDSLKERVFTMFPLARVAEITGVSIELIKKSARLYATSSSAVIPWSPITDQQLNSTSAIRATGILRALTGNLDAPGGEMFMRSDSDIISESTLELHERLPLSQKEKQLGSSEHPVYTYRAAEALKEFSQKVWRVPYPNIVKGTVMAVPSKVFRAMAYSDPYPVKAFFSIANNTLMGYANQSLIKKAILNQELSVCFELFMTPTANLCDYVLPGDTWMERPNLHDTFEWSALAMCSDQLYSPPPECRNIYDFWKGLADLMGLSDWFPWDNITALFDFRLAPLGMDFETFKSRYKTRVASYRHYKYEKTGFATPSGKVELHSSLLEAWGFDPLPYFREQPKTSEKFPLLLFIGVREPQFFQSGQRHTPALRKSNQEPKAFVHPATLQQFKIGDGEWISVETVGGKIYMQACSREEMPEGVVRIPHGWWKPEDKDLGEAKYSDAILAPDTADYLDLEQGVPHFKGIPCNILACRNQSVV